LKIQHGKDLLTKEDEKTMNKNKICELNLRTEDKLNQISRIESMKDESYKKQELIKAESIKMIGAKEQTNSELKVRLAKIDENLSRTKFKLEEVNKQNVLLNNSIDCDKSKSATMCALLDQDNISLNNKIVELNKYQDNVKTNILNVELEIQTISDKIIQQKL